jgi:signal transduction histidine kinase
MIRDLAAHHEKIREEERSRIAREIHDEFGQYLTALRMDTAMLKIRYGAGNPELKHHLDDMKQTIDATIGVVRNLAAALRPGALDMGLVSAAEWLLAGFEERTGIAYRLNAPREELVLDNERATAAFRILQEALTNITRYAHASEVEVTIERVENNLAMVVRDDGVGFDTLEVRGRKTFGLLGIRERALMFGGDSKIDSKPGGGTILRILIPLKA